MGLRPLAGVLALVCALAMAVVVVYQPAAGPSELEVRLRSVRYYRAMASADAYDAGPGAVQRAASSKARLQQLALSAPKGGQLSHSLIRACSGGDDGACAQIANSRSMMAALKHRVRHPGHRAVQRAVSVTAPAAPVRAALPVTARGRRAGARAPAGGQASDVAGLANWMSWNPEQAANNQWLHACEEGDASACAHMARSSSAMAALLESAKAPLPALPAYVEPPSPEAVYTAPRAPAPAQQHGVLGSVLAWLGLGDADYSSGVRDAPPPAKMDPDVGLTARGPDGFGVYNDGTPPPRTKWTRRVPHPVLIGHAARDRHHNAGAVRPARARGPAPPRPGTPPSLPY